MKHLGYNRETKEFIITEIGGVRPIDWRSVDNGQSVYLFCRNNDHEEMVCGPFTVKSAADRTLTNSKGRTFMHYAEHLMVKV